MNIQGFYVQRNNTLDFFLIYFEIIIVIVLTCIIDYVIQNTRASENCLMCCVRENYHNLMKERYEYEEDVFVGCISFTVVIIDD